VPPSSPESRAEAERLLRISGGVKPALDVLLGQFNVLQGRAQLLLTLATLVLTITGFSGPRIAAAGAFPRLALSLGLVLVLAAVSLVLASGLRIRWVTQFAAPDDAALLASVIDYRDRKTRAFALQLLLLGTGIAVYVAGVVVYFLKGAP
jgi:hypothetical protein